MDIHGYPYPRQACNVYTGVRARGLGWGCSPPDSGKTIIFRAKAKFFVQKPAAENEKNYIIFAFIKRKMNGIHSLWRDKVPEIRDYY